MTRLLFASTLLVVGLSGCVIPYRYTVTPHLAGWVSDATTKKAIPNAAVTVSTGIEKGMYHRSRTVLTDEKGGFDIPELKAWGVYIIPQDSFWPETNLHVEATGYQPYSAMRQHWLLPPSRTTEQHRWELLHLSASLQKAGKE